MIYPRCASLGRGRPGVRTSPALTATYVKFQLFRATTLCTKSAFSGGFGRYPELAVHQHKSTRYLHDIQLWDPAEHYPLSRTVLATTPQLGVLVDTVREQAESDP
jgi:hypothetical protein